MRKATSDYGVIVIDDKFIGFSLGHDYCAEHEWGHKEMKRDFGIPELGSKTLGVKSRSATKHSPNIIFKEETYKRKKFAVLYTGKSYNTFEKCQENTPYDLQNYKEEILWRAKYDEKRKEDKDYEPKDHVMTAWDGGGFGIGVMGVENIAWLKELYDAILKDNLTIAPMNRTPNNPFANASLSVLITDRLPKEFVNAMYNADKEAYDLIEYEKKIGLTKLKEKTRGEYHSHGYYVACSARWINYQDKAEREKEKKEYHTKFDIMYWVNYSDNDNTHDWFSVEEVKEWLSGKEKLSVIRARNVKKYGDV